MRKCEALRAAVVTGPSGQVTLSAYFRGYLQAWEIDTGHTVVVCFSLQSDCQESVSVFIDIALCAGGHHARMIVYQRLCVVDPVRDILLPLLENSIPRCLLPAVGSEVSEPLNTLVHATSDKSVSKIVLG